MSSRVLEEKIEKWNLRHNNFHLVGRISDCVWKSLWASFRFLPLLLWEILYSIVLKFTSVGIAHLLTLPLISPQSCTLNSIFHIINNLFYMIYLFSSFKLNLLSTRRQICDNEFLFYLESLGIVQLYNFSWVKVETFSRRNSEKQTF